MYGTSRPVHLSNAFGTAVAGATTASRLAASGGLAGFAHCPGAPPPSAATSARTTESQRGWCEPRTVRRAAARGVPAGVRAWLGLTWLGLELELELGLGLGLELGLGLGFGLEVRG